MRIFLACALMVIVTGALAGCGGSGGSTQAPDQPGTTPAPNAAPSPAPKGTAPSPKMTVPDPKGTSPSSSSASPETTADKGPIKVEISKGKLTLNGTSVSLPTDLATLEKILGKPTKTSDRGFNRTVCWIDLGIDCLQEKTGRQAIMQIAFNFEGFHDFDDGKRSKPFTGTITLEGQPVTKATDADEQSLKVPNIKKADLGGGFYIKYEDSTIVTISVDFLLKKVTLITVYRP